MTKLVQKIKLEQGFKIRFNMTREVFLDKLVPEIELVSKNNFYIPFHFHSSEYLKGNIEGKDFQIQRIGGFFDNHTSQSIAFCEIQEENTAIILDVKLKGIHKYQLPIALLFLVSLFFLDLKEIFSMEFLIRIVGITVFAYLLLLMSLRYLREELMKLLVKIK
jgi:hypothetical protein